MRPPPVCLAVAALALAGCAREPVTLVSAASAAPGAAAEGVAALGRIIPGDGVVELSAPYASTGGPSLIAEIKVRRGEAVKKGQVLAVLGSQPAALADLETARARVAVQEAALARVRAGAKPGAIAAQRATVEMRRAELEHARENLTRTSTLRRSAVAAEMDLEAATTQLTVAEKALAAALHEAEAMAEVRDVDVRQAEYELALARAEAVAAERRCDLSVLRSPLDGAVLEILRWPGELASGGTIMELAEVSRMGVEAFVYDSDVARVRRGADAVVAGPAFTGVLHGKVDEVGGVVMSSPTRAVNPDAPVDRRVVRVRIALDPADGARVAALNRHEVSVVIAR
ncbi:HlyD family efflux transporter periplasmic adaptor subunit [Opitutus sp. ER46]|uniref:HlyD family efflux transporter periplasmic adaptor subunit n=1 Tax=Opitutus sp. ER46 TaxID=2161864 RepID=UPI000D31931D|nr:HlyD family efflux transporter periplasmic adaptor subunit [Opitutus sp. ER46]PTX91749.1 hypothetical protein DB354_17975 [Opitutus sp. ER46]